MYEWCETEFKHSRGHDDRNHRSHRIGPIQDSIWLGGLLPRLDRENYSMIDLLIQVGCVLLVLAVISLFVCTIPIWLVVLVVVLLMGDVSSGRTEENATTHLGSLLEQMKHVRQLFCDPRFGVRHVRAKLKPCNRCGHEPIFIESGLDWPIYPFSSFRNFWLWCDECGQEVETSFEARKVPFRKRSGRVTYARRVDLNLQPIQMVGRWNQLNR